MLRLKTKCIRSLFFSPDAFCRLTQISKNSNILKNKGLSESIYLANLIIGGISYNQNIRHNNTNIFLKSLFYWFLYGIMDYFQLI